MAGWSPIYKEQKVRRASQPLGGTKLPLANVRKAHHCPGSVPQRNLVYAHYTEH